MKAAALITAFTQESGDDSFYKAALTAVFSTFAAVPRVNSVAVVYPAGREAAVREVFEGEKTARLIPAGAGRGEAVYKSLSLWASEAAHTPDYVLVHDGLRPWVEGALIEEVLDQGLRCGAALPLLPLTETPKAVDAQGFILRHLKRATLGIAQTPQAFHFPRLLAAYQKAAREGAGALEKYPDPGALWLAFDRSPMGFVPGSPLNRRITAPETLSFPGSKQLRPGAPREGRLAVSVSFFV